MARIPASWGGRRFGPPPPRSCVGPTLNLVANSGPPDAIVDAFEALDEFQSGFLGDPARGQILGAGVRANDVGAQRVERVGDERPYGLRRVTASLERRVDRVSDLDDAGLVVRGREAHVADEAAAASLLDGELHPPSGRTGSPP